MRYLIVEEKNENKNYAAKGKHSQDSRPTSWHQKWKELFIFGQISGTFWFFFSVSFPPDQSEISLKIQKFLFLESGRSVVPNLETAWKTHPTADTQDFLILCVLPALMKFH